MLKVTKSKSVAGAKEYFRDSLLKADYYTGGQKVLMIWASQGATRLGLSGEVRQEHFYRLLENRTPCGREKLTLRDKADRVPMIDFTISANKALSILWAFADTPQERALYEAIDRKAVMRMVEEIECNAQVRVRKGHAANTQTTRDTGNIIAAIATHETAREVDSFPDMQRHHHIVFINASYDPVEKCYKALEIGNLKGEAIYYEAIYHAEIARELSKLSFHIAPDDTKKGRFWYMEGLSQAFIEHFSRRTQQVEKTAKEMGITDPDLKSELGKKTREQKHGDLANDFLFDLWRSRLLPRFEKELMLLKAKAKEVFEHQSPVPLRTIVKSELAQAMRAQSIVSEKKLLADILHRGYGHYILPEAQAALECEDIIRGQVGGRVWITTAENYAKEQAIIRFAKSGRNSCLAMGHGNYEIQADFLNDQQRAAIHHIWRSKDKVIILRGGAGVGKTKGVMVETVAGIEAAGRKPHLFATTVSAVRDLKAEGYHGAATIQKLIANPGLQQQVGEHAVIWVEEAGMMDVESMHRLFELASEYHWRIILSGDEKQHKPTKRGDAMRILREEARLPVAEVTEIVRQTGIYKQAVAAIEAGQMEEGWKILEKMKAIIEVGGQTRIERLAADYLSTSERDDKVLVVAPTNQERAEVTQAIRAFLRMEGKIGKQEKHSRFLRNLYFEDDMKVDISRYEAGQIIRFRQNAKGGITSGSIFTIEEISDDGKLYGRDKTGALRSLPIDTPDRFDVFHAETRSFAKGDRVRAMEKGICKDKRELEKGQFYTIAGFNKQGEVELHNGMIVPADYAFLDHGYSSTSVSAQGLTVNTVLLAMGLQSLPAMSREQFYVSTSRGKRQVRIYVDDAELVREAIKVSGERPSATQLVRGEVTPEMTNAKQRMLWRLAHKQADDFRMRNHGVDLPHDASAAREHGSQSRMWEAHERI